MLSGWFLHNKRKYKTMSTFQQVTICGNLGDEPQSRTFQNGGSVVNLSIATTESWVDKTTGEKKSLTEWHRVVAYGKQAEVLSKYCSKGDKLLITGKLRTRKWTDQSNIERYSTEIHVDTFTFLTSKAQQTQAPAQTQNQNYSPAPPPREEEHDDLPF